MRRMFAVAVAACLLGVARAGEPPRAAPAGEAAAPAGKAAAPKKKEKGAKAPAPKAQQAERKGEAKPVAEKPCEPIRPCPVE